MIKIPQEDDVFPYLQPIIALETRSAYGYEVLGRTNKNQGIISLGPFFHDPEVPEEENF